MRVLIVERDSTFRADLRRMLSDLDSRCPVLEATTPVHARAVLEHEAVDIVVVSLTTCAWEEFETIRDLRRRSCLASLVVLCPAVDDTQLFIAVTLGASACVPRHAPPEILTSIIDRVNAGEHPIQHDVLSHPGATEQLLRWFRKSPASHEGPPVPESLSPRDQLILKYVALGHSNKEIGSRLGLTEQTVKNHVSAILRKLNANDRAHAAVIALTRGWIDLS